MKLTMYCVYIDKSKYEIITHWLNWEQQKKKLERGGKSPVGCQGKLEEVFLLHPNFHF